jgi:CheY-like chemotaxis protein
MRVEVLLAEDNLADVVMLTEAIRQAGLDYRLRVARDGLELLDLLGRHDSDAPDLIVLDLNLPRVNGFEILDFLRSKPDLRKIPTAILTTSAWEDEAPKLTGSDREAFFQKPSLLADWVAVVLAIEICRLKKAEMII